MDPYRAIIEKILSGEIVDREGLDAEKRRLSEELRLDRFVRSSEILRYAKPGERAKVLNLLRKKPMRTLSGVAVVAAMTQPSKCPHGRCRYCPGGPDIQVPQSYTGKEPATRRAIRYGFDPHLQVTFRLTQLKDIGHPIGKVELIVMGGTLTAQCLDYQEWFVKESLKAMNEFRENYGRIKELGEEAFIQEYSKSEKRFNYIEDLQEENEKSTVRCVGITFEPRPDWAKEEQINHMLKFGVTRVEIGVQNPDDRIYEKVERGHTVQDVVESTQQLKDSGLKVGYHMMPGILGYNPELDLKAFDEIIKDERFKPDMVKIYPCLVLKGTEYYDMWRRGEFRPLTTEEAVDLIVKVKSTLPKWMRTMRIQRDIPSPLIDAGVKASNLGELVYNEMEKRGIKCRCVRCREVGQMTKKGLEPEADDIELLRMDYDASGGREVFLSFDDTKKDILIGFLRLRIPNEPFRPEITSKTSLVRELHVYGPMLEVGEKPSFEWQHRGYGAELLAEAENLSTSLGMEKILVTSGIGVRDYYRRFGYIREGPYMSKKLT
ncbi:MAG: tRNA uridine(34) 5-carboxymethylaminomethyl modification radical SAM/GNAT enzyme Elp3 [Candidatus Altiarchaeota archaeon]|nr:tRNA uridine(34) 5-carboxymethylaminomethyl modification radical SAM/GNAT enzyme Elp3 [Candidatus Altiarchaeota archaeon]